jgi:predicted PurR-regulated permease PerM
VTAARWRIVLWSAMVLVVLWLAWQARWALLPFSVGALFAYVLTPAVDRVAALLPAHSHQQNVIRRGVAVLFVYVVIGAALTGAGLVIVPVAVDEVAQFIDDLPELIDDTQTQINSWLEVYRERVPEDARMRIDDFVADLGDNIGERLSTGTERTFDSLTTAIAVIVGFLVVPVWMFYALRDRHAFERNFSAALPEPVRPDVLNSVRIADQLIGRYLRGQLFLGLLVGIATFIGLTLLQVDLAIALAIFAGISELIPIIGPWIGALPAVVIVAATDPDKILWIVLLYLLVQQVENNFLVPRVQGHAVDIHPAVIIMLLAVAGTVFGFFGLIVVVPLTALLRELFWYADHRFRGFTPREALASTHVARRLSLDVSEEGATPARVQPVADGAAEVSAAPAGDGSGAPLAEEPAAPAAGVAAEPAAREGGGDG